MAEKKNSLSPDTPAQAEMLARLRAELDLFFDGNTSQRIKSLNNVLNAFLSKEGLADEFPDKLYIENTVYDITCVVDLLAACAEIWPAFKEVYPHLFNAKK